MNIPGKPAEVVRQLHAIPLSDPSFAIRFADVLIEAAALAQASDIHLQPAPKGLEIRWRLDGVLQNLGIFPRGESADVVARLKVLADLLTYRTDVPQEGRVRPRSGEVEIRVSTFPTLHGERAVVRLFAAQGKFQFLSDLGLPAEIDAGLRSALAETSGAVIVSGPAGSGKTTTAYACLREIVRRSSGGMSVVSLEDPIEMSVDGVSQSQVNPSAGFDLAVGLRSLLRQDPEVILVGEIRDRETAATALQASLTGHLVLTTFHAGSAAGAIARLRDMGLEPFQLRNGIAAVLCQRLVRRLCECSRRTVGTTAAEGTFSGDAGPETVSTQPGCAECLHTGYRGRALLAEMLPIQRIEIAAAILAGSDIQQLSAAAAAIGLADLARSATQAIETGITSRDEIRRVLGTGSGERI